MSNNEKIKVLISIPSLLHKSIYLPYIWGRLKTYVECDYDKHVNVEWLDPLYFHEIPDDIPECDVLGLSCYVWNWEKNLEIARISKQLNPNCFVIAGGPQVPYNQKNFFELYPEIDAVCYSEGEHIFAEVLYNLSNNISVDIDGMLLKTNPNKTRKLVPKMELGELTSAWLHCKDDFLRFEQEIRNQKKRVNVLLETNRGCPYKCAFCDWGSATNSKIKKFNFETIMQEIDFMCQLNPELVFVADANFGILELDLEFIKRFVRNINNYNMSRMQVNICPAKNKKHISNESLRLLYENKLAINSVVSFQHTDDEVLSIMDRDNIKVINSVEEVKEYNRIGIPSAGVLIIGNPGDTLSKLKGAFDDLLCMGFHDEIRLHDYMLLPNAPAAAPEYVEKWKIGYIEKMYLESPDRTPFKTRFIAECFSFTKNDYIEMQLYSSFIQSMHNLSLFKFVAMLAYHSYNVSYTEFYDQILQIPIIKTILDEVRSDLNEYVLGDKQHKFITYHNKMLNYENYIFLRCIENLNEVYQFDTYGKDIMELQRNIVVNGQPKKDFVLDYDFKRYFHNIQQLEINERGMFMPEKIKTNYKFKHFSVGPYEDIDTTNFKIKDITNKVLGRLTNYRHRITYYNNVLQ